eukprot:1989987-Prymnesium_polylepis.2
MTDLFQRAGVGPARELLPVFGPGVRRIRAGRTVASDHRRHVCGVHDRVGHKYLAAGTRTALAFAHISHRLTAVLHHCDDSDAARLVPLGQHDQNQAQAAQQAAEAASPAVEARETADTQAREGAVLEDRLGSSVDRGEQRPPAERTP